MSDDDIAIKVVGVSKSFMLPHEKTGSIKNVLLGWCKRRRGYETQQVLKDISFEVKKGDFFGIVGRNGGGKSTLLKLLAGIYTPDKGEITVNGKLTPFIELGVGFNQDLSGRENVFLNGALLGFSREEVQAMYDDIVSFAELERFMDQKLKNYSSGMQVRLAFSIAIRANSDILLIDEVLAVGDSNFQRKCFEVFNQIKNSGKTVLFISHDSASVKRYCNKAILIDSGKLVYSGTPEKVIDKYNELNIRYTNANLLVARAKGSSISRDDNKDVSVVGVVLLDGDGKPRYSFGPREKFVLRVIVKSTVDTKNPVVRVAGVHAGGGMAVFACSTKLANRPLGDLKAGQRAVVDFEIENNFHDCELDIHASIFDEKEQELLYNTTEGVKFISLGWESGIIGSVYPDVKVTIKKD